MKFATHQDKTMELLSKWANRRQLHFAKFFFWNSGFEIQRSQHGLLQSLLCQICRMDPDLVTSICPEHQKNEPWSIDELKDVFEKLVDKAPLRSAFCFFIDGLDEYDGEEKDIIDFLRSFSRAENFKICASSRPWNAFEKAFNDPQRTLIVQKHTIEDMKAYVHGMLEEHVEFQRLSADDPQCLSLIPEIANRAQGVWLWVFLVVKDLIHDIEGKEDYDLLKQRLDAVPSKLEEYFERIMGQIDNFYKREAAQIFLIAIEAVEPILLYGFAHLDIEKRNPNFALATDLRKPLATELEKICDTWRVKLKSRCRDLLKVQSRSHWSELRVEFLHRTVRDWLRDNHLATLRRQAHEDFDPVISLCRLTLACLRYCTHPSLVLKGPWDNLDTPEGAFVVSLISQFTHYAHVAQHSGKAETTFSHIEALEGILTTLLKAKKKRWGPFLDEKDPNPNFLAMTINLGLTKYAHYNLKKNPKYLKNTGHPLLIYALAPGLAGCNSLNEALHCRQIDLGLVEYLLSQGADPNQEVSDRFNVMSQCVYRWKWKMQLEVLSKEDQEAMLKAAKLLIAHGGQLQPRPLNLLSIILRLEQIEELKVLLQTTQ
jgi:hypothetical protein